MLVDVHAHFYHQRTPRADWRERNESRLTAGARIGVSVHVASILGSFGFTSPTYFPSPRDVTAGKHALPPPPRPHPPRIPRHAFEEPHPPAPAPPQNAPCLAAPMTGVQPAAGPRA